MITLFLKSTLSIVSAILPKKKAVKEEILEPTSVSEIKEELPAKDKIMFQPNTLATNGSLDFPANQSNNLEQQPTSEQPAPKQIISISVDNSTINHIQGLCRFFEINEFDVLAKGIWLLTLVRDIEVNNKKLGVISVDKNGLVIDVSPVNIV